MILKMVLTFIMCVMENQVLVYYSPAQLPKAQHMSACAAGRHAVGDLELSIDVVLEVHNIKYVEYCIQ